MHYYLVPKQPGPPNRPGCVKVVIRQTLVYSGQDELLVLIQSFEAFDGIQMVFHRRLKGARVQRNERSIEEPQRGKVHILIIRCIEACFAIKYKA